MLPVVTTIMLSNIILRVRACHARCGGGMYIYILYIPNCAGLVLLCSLYIL